LKYKPTGDQQGDNYDTEEPDYEEVLDSNEEKLVNAMETWCKYWLDVYSKRDIHDAVLAVANRIKEW
jgi:hypothetical protein